MLLCSEKGALKSSQALGLPVLAPTFEGPSQEIPFERTMVEEAGQSGRASLASTNVDVLILDPSSCPLRLNLNTRSNL
jgi:hypothetical protein